MTRETKIGLLVGLAFIIVIGILLSDHMATTTEPQQAALDNAAAGARSAIVVPNEARNGTVVPNNIAVRDVAPAAQVPTRGDLVQQPVVRDIQIGGPATPSGTTRGPVTGNAQVAVNSPDNAIVGNTGNTQAPVEPARHNTAGIDPALIAAGHTGGEPFINIGTGQPASTGDTSHTDTNTVRPTPPASTAKTYTVEAGDTLGRIASKTMGANSKANRDAIVKANPSLAANPDKVVLGMTYTIPSAAAPAPATPTGNTRVLPLVPVQPPTGTARGTTPAPSADQPYTYTVKSGDNLYRIATEHAGNAQAVAAIKELNKDVLKGSDVVRIGMRLKLPAKPVASVN